MVEKVISKPLAQKFSRFVVASGLFFGPGVGLKRFRQVIFSLCSGPVALRASPRAQRKNDLPASAQGEKMVVGRF